MSARFEVRLEDDRHLRLNSRTTSGASASHSIVGDPTAFYVFVSVTARGHAAEYRQSDWVRGNAGLYHKLRRLLTGAIKQSFIAACMQVIKEYPRGSR